MSFLDRAKPLAELGIPVFPLAAGTKVPPKGMHFTREATTDLEQIAKWNEIDPNFNVAMLAQPEGFVFLEFDIPNGMEQAAAEFGEKMPRTRTQKSGHGYRSHWIFRQDDHSRALGNRNANSREPCTCTKPKDGKPRLNTCECAALSEPHHHHEWFSLRQSNRYLLGAGSIHPDTGAMYQVVDKYDSMLFGMMSWVGAFVDKYTVAEDLPSVVRKQKPEGSGDVSEEFDFEDMTAHMHISIRANDDPWMIVDECPGVGRRHENSIKTGFYWDGAALGWKCFAESCPLSNANLLQVYGKKGIAGFLMFMNDRLREAGEEPYTGIIWPRTPLDPELVDELGVPENGAETDTPKVLLLKKPFMLTDLGNAERLEWRHGRKFKHTKGLDWMCWDGMRWLMDETGRINRATWNTVRLIPEETQLIKVIPTPNDAEDPTGEKKAEQARAAIRHWAFESENGGHIEKMTQRAESAKAITLPDGKFDHDLGLLNTRSGTVDLHTGIMRPHDRADLLTKLSPVDYDPEATCPLWEKFLLEIMDGSKAMADFLARALGYSLTGETKEHKMFVLWGSGANGKSTLLETVRFTLGDYAEVAEFNTFVAKKEARTGPNSDIAKLRGARFVSATEGESGHKLAESLVKQLTGGDSITACFKFKEYFTFLPQFKMWLASNHKPEITGTDDGIWRRICLIPFAVSFVGREDMELTDKLKAEAPGILAWMVRGLMEWRKHGLMAPDEVLHATAEYRADEDVFQRFALEECEIWPREKGAIKFMSARNAEEKQTMAGWEVAARDLYERWQSWARRNREPEISERKFSDMVKERGFIKDSRSKGRFWLGLKLKASGYAEVNMANVGVL